jgi:hypothetical protein
MPKKSKKPEDITLKNGIYRIPPQDIADLLSDPHYADDNPKPTFFPDPLSFLRAWQEGYTSGKSKIYRGTIMGFELYLPSGMMLASDVCDIFLNHLSLGVNDIDHQRILVYKPQDYIGYNDPDLWRENTFMTGEPQGMGREIYPLTSHNTLKADEKQWVMFGYSPQEFYQDLKAIGFSFPD